MQKTYGVIAEGATELALGEDGVVTENVAHARDKQYDTTGG